MKDTDDDLSERLGAAAQARKAALDKFRARAAPDDPAVAERRAARQAVSAAREARTAERKAARIAKDAREEAERLDREKLEHAEREREAAEAKEREKALEAERKAARDARYLARKGRK